MLSYDLVEVDALSVRDIIRLVIDHHFLSLDKLVVTLLKALPRHFDHLLGEVASDKDW